MKTDFSVARQNMIDSQIKPFSVIDTRVLGALGGVKREDFVPDDRKGLAYSDEDLPFGNGRFLIEPPAYARLLQEAELREDFKVLDVGCLTGYTSAVLADIVAEVVAVDRAEWVVKAAKNVKNADKHNVTFVEGEPHEGSAEYGPYDVIVINGAVQTVPQSLVNQLQEGGKIATFFRDERGASHAVVYHKHHGDLRKQILFDAFVPVLPGFEKQEGFVF